MLSCWACFNGLIVVGLLFAAGNGIKTDTKGLIEQIYDHKSHVSVRKADNTLNDGEFRYVVQRAQKVVEEKLRYVIGFCMSAIGTFCLLWWESNPPKQMCQRRLELLLAIIMWMIVAKVLKYIFTEIKMWKIVKSIKKDADILFSEGDFSIVCDSENEAEETENNENSKS